MGKDLTAIQTQNVQVNIFQEIGKVFKEVSPFSPYAGIVAFAYVFSVMINPSEVSARELKDNKKITFLFWLRIVVMSCLGILFLIAIFAQI